MILTCFSAFIDRWKTWVPFFTFWRDKHCLWDIFYFLNFFRFIPSCHKCSIHVWRCLSILIHFLPETPLQFRNFEGHFSGELGFKRSEIVEACLQRHFLPYAIENMLYLWQIEEIVWVTTLRSRERSVVVWINWILLPVNLNALSRWFYFFNSKLVRFCLWKTVKCMDN